MSFHLPAVTAIRASTFLPGSSQTDLSLSILPPALVGLKLGLWWLRNDFRNSGLISLRLEDHDGITFIHQSQGAMSIKKIVISCGPRHVFTVVVSRAMIVTGLYRPFSPGSNGSKTSVSFWIHSDHHQGPLLTVLRLPSLS